MANQPGEDGRKTCEIHQAGLSAPLFMFGGATQLAAVETDRLVELGGTMRPASFTLAGRSAKLDPQTLPVRGDLAHLRLAGQVFVPHYAVPMPHVALTGGATLRKSAKAEAEVLRELSAGAGFDVLDMAGDWAWGEFVAPDGGGNAVGYVRLAQLAVVK